MKKILYSTCALVLLGCLAYLYTSMSAMQKEEVVTSTTTTNANTEYTWYEKRTGAYNSLSEKEKTLIDQTFFNHYDEASAYSPCLLKYYNTTRFIAGCSSPQGTFLEMYTRESFQKIDSCSIGLHTLFFESRNYLVGIDRTTQAVCYYKIGDVDFKSISLANYISTDETIIKSYGPLLDFEYTFDESSKKINMSVFKNNSIGADNQVNTQLRTIEIRIE